MPTQRSADILRLQRALKREGFDPGPLDGIPGEKTSKAYLAYLEKVKNQPQGIDVSRWQPKVDWHKVATIGAEAFAYCKATTGTSGVDPLFSSHYAGIKAAGMLRGVYHWFKPSVSLVGQADNVYRQVGKLGQGDLPPWIDVERDDAGADQKEGTTDDVRPTDQQIEDFADLIEDRLGKRPIIYSYSYYLDDRDIEVPSCPLAIADYRSGPPTLPPGWPRHLFHQFLGDKGTEPGVEGPCDQVRFNGSLGELRALAGY